MIFNIIWTTISGGNRLSVVNQFVKSNKSVKDMAVLVQSIDGSVLIEETKGEMDHDTPFALASVSKLYTHALIFRLIDEGKLSYDDKIISILPPEDTEDIHVLNEKNYSSEITVRHLIDQSSGLPDYETDKQTNGNVLFTEILEKDIAIGYLKSLEITKNLEPKFLPGSENKSYYSSVNANLLGRIAEIKTEKTYNQLLNEYIVQPLELRNTYTVKADGNHSPIYIDDKPVQRPIYLSGSIPSGGIISTNKELMIFVNAYFGGELFKKSHIENPMFNKIQFFPIEYGSGMMRVKMSRLMSPLIPAPEIIGHSGSSGTFAYYCPSKKVFITGTINQVRQQPYPIIYMYLSSIQ